MITVALCAFALGAVLGWAARHFRVLSWAAARVASALGARWFITAQVCSGCRRHAHLMREAGPGTYRCVRYCRALDAAQSAPDAPLRAERVDLGTPLGPEAPRSAQGRSQGRDTTITEEDGQ